MIYLHVAEADVIYLMDIYGKGEQQDLTASQKKILKRLAEETSLAAIRVARSLRRGRHE